MSKTPRSPTESVASDVSEASIFCGVGSPRPKPRLLSGTLFGHVEGAFDEKTLPIGFGCDKNGKTNGNNTAVEKPTEKEENQDSVTEDTADEKEKVAENDLEEVNGCDESRTDEETADDVDLGKTDDTLGTDSAVQTELEGKGPMPVSEAVSFHCSRVRGVCTDAFLCSLQIYFSAAAVDYFAC